MEKLMQDFVYDFFADSGFSRPGQCNFALPVLVGFKAHPPHYDLTVSLNYPKRPLATRSQLVLC